MAGIYGLQHWDGTGGNGAALRHFEATGKQYPLVVKLGTITPTGADVFSYAEDENDMVLDPHLEEHLTHWGINMLQVIQMVCLNVLGKPYLQVPFYKSLYRWKRQKRQ